MTFKTGKSGNPKGRPKGIADKRTAWRQALEPRGKELMTKAVELALAGDSSALKLCLDRIAPSIRPQAEPIRFELHGDTLTEKAESVLCAVADGVLDPHTGKALIDSIGSLVKVSEVDEITRRLDQLEGKDNAQRD